MKEEQIYDGYMDKWRSIDLGQVFTPLHMAAFAAKLLDIGPDDHVIDSSAGTGALLLSAINRGCKNVYAVEYDSQAAERLRHNLAETDANFETLNADATSAEVYEWILDKPITKAILNPPYEKKYNSLDIFINTLKALPVGTKIAVFYPTNQLDKMTKKQSEWFKENCNVTAKIDMPLNLFQPFVSVATSIYLITKGEEQGDIFFCSIPDDGLVRKKNKYREDTNGKWRAELEPYYYKVITAQIESDTAHIQSGEKGYSYQPPLEPPTKEDFMKVVSDYMDFKIKRILGDRAGWDDAQQRLAALAYTVGAENVLDAIENPDRYMKNY